MKRVAVLFLALLAVFTFISCNNEVAAPAEDVRMVSFSTNGLSRSLEQTLGDVSSMYWKYTAVKADSTGLETGKQESPTTVGSDGNITNKVGPFSHGDWTFTLYGARTSAEAEAGKYAYTGTAFATIKDSASIVNVTVVPSITEGGRGTLVIKEDISLSDGTNEIVSGTYKVLIEVKKVGGDIIPTPEPAEGVYTFTDISSGSYAVNVKYTALADDSVVYGEDTIYATIFDNLTTTIGGSLNQKTSETQFSPDVNGSVIASAEAVINASEDNTVAVTSSPVDPFGKDDMAKTAVLFPAGTLTGETAKLEVKAYSALPADTKFIIEGKEGGIVGAVDLKLNGEESSNFGDKKVTVTTYIYPGLGTKEDIKVIYNGDKSELNIVSYDNATGELVFETNHFSEFIVTSKNAVACVDGKNTVHSTLSDAVSSIKDNSKYVIKLLADTTEDKLINVLSGRQITVDLNGHDIYLYDGVWNREASSVFVNKNASLTLNGKGLIRAGYKDSERSSVNLEIGAVNNKYLFRTNGKLTIDGDIVIGGLLEDHPSSRAIGVKPAGELYVNNGLIRTFSASQGSSIYNEGKVVINGGTVLSCSYAISTVAGGVLELNDGSLISIATNKFLSSSGSSLYAYCVSAGGELKATGGEVYGVQGAVSVNYNKATIDNIHAETTRDVFSKIEEASDQETAEAYSNFYKINSKKGDNFVIDDGELFYGLYAAGERGDVNPVIVNGGTFISGARSALYVGNSADGGIGAFAGVTVYGGTFIGKEGGPALVLDAGTEDGYGKGDLKVYGGTYSSKENLVPEEGYEVVEIDNRFEVVKINN